MFKMLMMFCGAAAFGGDMAGWDVTACGSMGYIFFGAAAFSGDVAGWDVSACKNMKDMFYNNAEAFDAAKNAPWYKP